MNINTAQTICPGCFTNKGHASICTTCGYDESERRSPLVLPHHTILHGQYHLGKLLGKPGGFGITYLAMDQKLNVKVAIKEYLPRDLAGRDSNDSTIYPHSKEDAEFFAKGLDDFLKEAQNLAQFDHANIVRVRNFFRENGTAYIVMDYYDGITLNEYVHNMGGKVEWQMAIKIMTPIMDALREVHTKGFLHRDIKPHNIYLTRENRIILLDFGSARQAMGERSKSLSMVLTPGYAPFEQYHKRGNQGPWTDVYGVAATLYFMIMGEVPPEANGRVERDNIHIPSQMMIALPQSIERALMKALAVKASDRFENILALQNGLGEIPVSVKPNEYQAAPQRQMSETVRNPVSPKEKTSKGEAADAVIWKKQIRYAVFGLIAVCLVSGGLVINSKIAESKRKAAIAAEQEKAEKSERENVPILASEQERLDKAEKVRVPKLTEVLKAEKERLAIKEAEQKRVEKADKERLARSTAEQKRVEKAERERLVRSTAEQEKFEKADRVKKAEMERLALISAEQERIKNLERAKKAEKERAGRERPIYTDPQTGLMWPKNGNIAGNKMSWYEALTWSKNLNYAGYNDWRLPTKEELESFARGGGGNSKEGFNSIQANHYWTSSSDNVNSNHSWVVNLGSNYVGTYFKSNLFNVLPVRN